MKLSSLKKSLSKTTILVILILAAATFLRLYNLKDTVEFLGDQGRDAIVVSQIFTERNFVFIGPVTSVGNMYLGPFYYYFMLPFLYLSYPSPMGPVYGVALAGVISVMLIYKLGKDLVGTKPAMIASFFYTFCAVVIKYSRFSWNPNLMPLFSLILIWATWKAWKKNSVYWLLAAVCFSILLQLHYVSLLSMAGFGIIWLIQLIELIKAKNKQKDIFKLILMTLSSVLIVVTSAIPLLLFDYKHSWFNTRAFVDMFNSDKNFAQAENARSLFSVVKETHGRSMHILFEYTIGQHRTLNTMLVITVLAIICYLLKTKQKNPYYSGLVVITSFLVTGIIGTSFYQHTVFVHYISYLFPITFLCYGLVAEYLTKKKIGWILVLIFTGFFLKYNLPLIPLKSKGWTMVDTQRVSDTIAKRVKPGEKYNIVLLSETGDLEGQSYRYFLTTTETKPVKIEERGSVDTLFVINEDKKIKDVTTSEIYEIVVFPNKKVSEIYQVENGPEITVLKRN